MVQNCNKKKKAKKEEEEERQKRRGGGGGGGNLILLMSQTVSRVKLQAVLDENKPWTRHGRKQNCRRANKNE